MDDDGSPRKRQREITRVNVSDVMRLAREIWHPTDPYKQGSEKEEDRKRRHSAQ